MLPDLESRDRAGQQGKGDRQEHHHRAPSRTRCCPPRAARSASSTRSRPSSTPTSARSSSSRSRPSSTRSPIPTNQITVERRAGELDPEAEVGDELLSKLPQEKFGRIAAQAAKQNIIQRVREAEREHHLQRVQGPQGRAVLRHRAALRAQEHHRQPGPHRRDPAREGADPARALPPGRPHPRLHPRRRAHQQGAADRPLAHASRPPHQALRAGGARDLRGHRRGEGRRARAGRARQDRGVLARSRRRSGRRLRRHARHARPVGGAGAARREDRHRPVDARSGGVRLPRALAREGLEDHHGRGRARDGGDRPRRSALARDRQEGPERPAGVAAHRLASRRARRGRGRGGGAQRACLADVGSRASATSPPSCSTSTASSRRRSSRRPTSTASPRSTASSPEQGGEHHRSRRRSTSSRSAIEAEARAAEEAAAAEAAAAAAAARRGRAAAATTDAVATEADSTPRRARGRRRPSERAGSVATPERMPASRASPHLRRLPRGATRGGAHAPSSRATAGSSSIAAAAIVRVAARICIARGTCLEAFARRGGFVRSLRCVIAKAERETPRRAQLPEVQG